MSTNDHIFFGLYKGATNTAAARDLSAVSASAATPVLYDYTVPAGKTAVLARINLFLTDAGQDMLKFGGVSARTNGLKVYTKDAAGATITNFTTDTTIKKNADWALFAGPDGATTDVLGAGDDTLVVRWTLEKSGRPISLDAGESFIVQVQDDLTSVTEFRAQVQGYYL